MYPANSLYPFGVSCCMGIDGVPAFAAIGVDRPRIGAGVGESGKCGFWRRHIRSSQIMPKHYLLRVRTRRGPMKTSFGVLCLRTGLPAPHD